MQKRKTHLVLCLVFCLGLVGCRQTVATAGAIPYGILSRYEGCKTSDATSTFETAPRGSNQECVTYEYDGGGLLSLTHINSGFNCCPGKITADVVVFGNKFYIEEKEEQQGCFCRCLFDLQYEVRDLEPGEYTIEIRGLYVEETDEALRTGVILIGPSSGTVCVDRTHYPWSPQS